MYQGASDDFMGPRDPITAASEDLGVDLEAEIVVITNDVPLGVNADDALRHIVLLGLVNDVTLRNVVLPELAKGFGFLQGKPASALSPVLVTPDELQPYWRGGKLHRPMQVWLNDRLIGQPQAGEEMQFHFGELIAHAARARPAPARCWAAARSPTPATRRRLLPGGSARARSCAMAKCARHSSSMATACGSACATMPARACSAISTRRWKFPPRGRCRPRPRNRRSLNGARDGRIRFDPRAAQLLAQLGRLPRAHRAGPEKGQPYRSVTWQMAQGEHLQPAYRRLAPFGLAPFGLVPMLDIDGLRLQQSLAIIEYLEERNPEPALLPPGRAARAPARWRS